jgi:hypothetical protein
VGTGINARWKVFQRVTGTQLATTRKVINISSNHSSFRFGAARQLIAIVMTVAAFAAIPALASAQTIDPTTDQYSNVLQQVSRGGTPDTPPSCSDTGSSGSASGSASSSCASAPEAGGLPFTGLDVAALAAVAGFLLLAGVALRRARFGERDTA